MVLCLSMCNLAQIIASHVIQADRKRGSHVRFFILQENIMGIPRYLSNKIENEISQIDYFKKKVIV